MMTKTPLILATLGAFTLAGCMDPNPQGNPDNQRARSGALAGALIGGALGATSGGGRDTFMRTAAGAVVGGALGGAIGTTLDRQAADLRRDLGNDVGVVRAGDTLVVTMPQDLLFAIDSANLRPDLQRDLRTVAGSLMQYPGSQIEVIGHTDNTGAAAYNNALSQRRANAVAGQLLGAGVPSARVVAYGRGEDAPLASNLTPEGRAQNRRVEIVIRHNS